MTLVEIKTKLHEQIEHSDEGLLNMIYDLMKEYEDTDDTEARKKLILEEQEKHLLGISKSYSWEEVKNMAINNQKP